MAFQRENGLNLEGPTCYYLILHVPVTGSPTNMSDSSVEDAKKRIKNTPNLTPDEISVILKTHKSPTPIFEKEMKWHTANGYHVRNLADPSAKTPQPTGKTSTPPTA